jgi:two-component system, OmpR family, phosphate regulon response regulator PhoB
MDMSIVVVEDDPIQGHLLASWLKSDGFNVDLFSRGREAKTHLQENTPDLLVLDFDLPDTQGDEILRWVRGRIQATIPIIFQTVHDGEDDISQILNAGADDYLVKPLSKGILLARVHAVLRRSDANRGKGRSLSAGNVTLTRFGTRATIGDFSVSLGEKEFGIAWTLARKLGTVVMRQEILSEVWGHGTELETRTVDMHVSRLRNRFRDLPDAKWDIQTLYGLGYRLTILEEKK